MHHFKLLHAEILESIKWRLKKNKLNVVGSNNKFNIEKAQMKQTYIKIRGNDNLIIVDDLSYLSGCRITIYGDNNTIHIGKDSLIYEAELWLEGNVNEIEIGKNTFIAGKTHLAAIEGRKIIVSEDCMFSSDIRLSTGDSHSIITLDGKRINQSKDIVVGRHCWIGTKVIVLKGTELANNCVIGAGSLLSGKYETAYCAYGGTPAHLLKENITWVRELI